VPAAAPRAGAHGTLRLTDRLVLVFIGALTAGVHVAAIALGLRFSSDELNGATLSQVWQLLPVGLLRHDLFQSVVRLQSQPPLFNLVTGGFLELPHVTQPWAADAGMFVCAGAVALGTAGMLLELGVSRVTVLVVVIVFVVADPAQFLYTTYYFYALPTAALVTLSGWTAARWVRTERLGPGLAYGVLAAALILTNSSYQVYTVALATVPVLWVLRRRWREAVAALLVPLAVVAVWYSIDLVQFGSATTSGWLGMNLARATVQLDSSADIDALIKQGALTPTAAVRPFSPLSAYGSLGEHVPTGQQALDQRLKPGTKAFPNPNYNNIAYIGIAKSYFTNDLHWIEHRPLHYLKNTTIGLRLWLLPSEQYFATVGLGGGQTWHLDGYTTVYDEAVLLQGSPDPNAALTVVEHQVGPSLSNVSMTLALETLFVLVVLPIVAWRRRKVDRARAAAALWVWVICASVFVTTTLLETAENNRFRFELGGLPLVGATVAAVWLFDRSGLGRQAIRSLRSRSSALLRPRES
jgi:hypothetical protein